MEFLKNTGINENAIKQMKGKQLLYGSIYAFNSVKLETLKIYIKTHRKTRFIWPFKSLTGIFIFFGKKPNDNLQFYVNYTRF